MKIKRAQLSIGLLILFFASGSAHATLIAWEYGSTVDNSNQEVTFFINFNEAPDFFTVDSAGKQADSFQYYIDVDASNPNPGTGGGSVDSLVRGGEIHIDGDIRIRDHSTPAGSAPSSDPNSGGWGPIRGSVPYILSGTSLLFTTPWSFLHDTDGVFTYQLLLCEYGGATDYLYGLSGESYEVPKPAVTPIPSVALLLIAGLTSFSVIRKKCVNVS